MNHAKKGAKALLKTARYAGLFVLFLTLALSAPLAGAEEANPFAEPLKNVLSYFTPMEGTVQSVTNTTVLVRLREDARPLPGMRLRIFRKGEPFLHPVTGETIVQGERPVGTGEVKEAGEGSAGLMLVEGEAAPGDVVRISSGRVRMLFYQSESVDWDVSEEYYFWLKDTGRFAIAETSPGPHSMETATGIARDMGAKVVLIINSAGSPAQPGLSHSLVWASNGKVILNEEFPLDIVQISTLKIGEEYFTPDRNKPVSKLKIPYTANLIATGDLDGNGEHELLAASGSSIYFYSVSARLEPAFESRKEISIKGSLGSSYVWLEAVDLDHDGKDEILLSSISGQMVTSSIYKYDGLGFVLLWSGPGFIRNISGTLYSQPSDPMGGFAGKPEPLDWDPSGAVAEDEGSLPEGRDLYNMAFLHSPGQSRHRVSFGDRGHLIVNSPEGWEKWKSGEPYIGFTRKYPKTYIAEITEKEEQWAINDRLLSERGAVLTFKRLTRKTNIKGLGYKKTRFMALYLTPSGEIRESLLIDGIRGGARDFAVADGRLYILSASYALSPLNLFRGKKLFSSKLYVYTLIGGK
jgi:hypothetical protein